MEKKAGDEPGEAKASLLEERYTSKLMKLEREWEIFGALHFFCVTPGDQTSIYVLTNSYWLFSHDYNANKAYKDADRKTHQESSMYYVAQVKFNSQIERTSQGLKMYIKNLMLIQMRDM